MSVYSIHQISVRSLPEYVFLEFFNLNIPPKVIPLHADVSDFGFRAMGTDSIFYVDRRWNNFTLQEKIRERVLARFPDQKKEFAGFSFGIHVVRMDLY